MIITNQNKEEKMSVPALKMWGMPVWCHHHCGKMVVNKEESDLSQQKLVIEGSAAKLTIEFHNNYKGTNYWLVAWQVIQSRGEGVTGTMYFSQETLAAAFGLTDDLGEWNSAWLINQYGATLARQSYFIRWERFLNIPCPGTGHDGDPNISIELHNQTIQAVKELLNTQARED